MNVGKTPSWTVLIYTSPSHDLEQAVEDSLDEIRDTVLPEDVTVVAQRGKQDRFQRFDLKGGDLSAEQPGDMSDPQLLKDFLDWGMKNYPAERYAVVLGGHAAGFAGALTNANRTRMIPLPEVADAIASSPHKPELVVFNTCLMAQAEVLDQLQGHTDAVVASQSKLLGLGLPLAPWLQQLPEITEGGQAADTLSELSKPMPERAPDVSSLHLGRWDQLRGAVDGLAAEVMKHPEQRVRLLEHVRAQAEYWPRPHDRPLVDQLDLGALSKAWQDDLSLPEGLREKAAQVGAELPHTAARGGLSLFVPDAPFERLGPPQRTVGDIYAELRWSDNTRWDEAITWLVKPEPS